MKVLHTADNHLQNNKALLADTVKCTDFMADQAITERPGLIVQAGDFWDFYKTPIEVGSPAELAGTALVKKLKMIAPCVFIRGTNSHDADNSMAIINSIGQGYPAYATDRIEQIVINVSSIESKISFKPIDSFNPGATAAVISCLPSINKANLMSTLAGSVADTNRDMVDLIRDVLQAWGIVNERARHAGIPTILIFHGTVTGSRLSTGQTMAGKDLELTLGDILLAKAELNCFGHIHMKQSWSGAGYWAGYSGSITRLDHGETEEKGFWIHELSGNDNPIISTFHETPARTMRTKRPEGLPGVEVVDDVQQGDLVRIVYEVAEADIGKVDEEAIRQAALAKGAAEVKIEKVIIQTVRVRAEGISREKSLSAKLDRWAEASGYESPEDLYDKLADLQVREVEEIIEDKYEPKKEVAA